MKISHRVGVVTAGLLLASSSLVEAKIFGYVNLKAGYSLEKLAQGDSYINNGTVKASYKGSSSSVVPFGASLGFGNSFSPRFHWRIEAEYLYRPTAQFQEDTQKHGNNGVTDVTLGTKASMQNLLGNVYLDYYVIPSLFFYASSGLGVNFLNATVSHRSDGTAGSFSSPGDAGFAWQAGLGMGVLVTSNVSLDLNVRYSDFGTTHLVSRGDFSGTLDLPLSSLDVLLGVSYRF